MAQYIQSDKHMPKQMINLVQACNIQKI